MESKFAATHIKVIFSNKHLITDHTCQELDSILFLSRKDSTYAQSVTANRTISKSAVNETTTKNFAARIAKSRLTPTIHFRTGQNPRPLTMDNLSNITEANIRKRRIRPLPKFWKKVDAKILPIQRNLSPIRPNTILSSIHWESISV